MEKRKVPCPVCKKQVTWMDNPFRPFCSERCRLMDLGKWASEEYRIAGEKKISQTEEEDEIKNRDDR